ncbi:hypothetical protein FN846DRAFT_990791, partial [Sphaerosporella brunnea]
SCPPSPHAASPSCPHFRDGPLAPQSSSSSSSSLRPLRERTRPSRLSRRPVWRRSQSRRTRTPRLSEPALGLAPRPARGAGPGTAAQRGAGGHPGRRGQAPDARGRGARQGNRRAESGAQGRARPAAQRYELHAGVAADPGDGDAGTADPGDAGTAEAPRGFRRVLHLPPLRVPARAARDVQFGQPQTGLQGHVVGELAEDGKEDAESAGEKMVAVRRFLSFVSIVCAPGGGGAVPRHRLPPPGPPLLSLNAWQLTFCAE